MVMYFTNPVTARKRIFPAQGCFFRMRRMSLAVSAGLMSLAASAGLMSLAASAGLMSLAASAGLLSLAAPAFQYFLKFFTSGLTHLAHPR